MLVRIHLLMRDPPLQRRLRKLLAGLDVRITADAGRDPPATAVGRLVTDLCIARESLLGADLDPVVDALAGLRERPDLVVFTRSTDAEHRTALAARGVSAVLGERDGDEDTRAALTRLILERAERTLEVQRARSVARPPSVDELVAESPAMQRLMPTIRKVLGANSTLLIAGETGAGKEVLARAIHQAGPRSRGPFVAVNCSALPDSLIESELFGHEAGAFTDAQRQKRGKFELAHGGTIFLDEIASMPLHLQTRLLRVLQDRELQRLGSEETIPIDVRVIAATHADLTELVRQRTFRADLFYRLAVVVLELPPLRERREDLPRLAARHLEAFARQFGRPGLHLSAAALERLIAHDWPGNVRELVNAIERAALLADGDTLEAVDFAQLGAGLPPAPPPGADAAVVDLRELADQPWIEARDALLARFGSVYVRELLRRHHGRIGAAARAMGVNPRSLYDQMRKLGIDKREFRDG
jgi:DNA-binding NtrC family response regulator